MIHGIVTCLIIAAAPGFYAQEFDRAAAAYNAADYNTAIQTYERLAAESVAHEALFYNLANAYYRAGRLGPAIANYERAIDLDPAFDNARDNLQKAVGETKQRLARPLPTDWEQSLLFWHYLVSAKTTNRIALASWLSLWLVLALRQVRPLRYTRRTAALLAILAIAFAGSAWAKAHAPALAVANAEPTPVRYGISQTGTVRFDLYPGDRVTVDLQKDGWARVTTASGERGWTQTKNLILVGPPYQQANHGTDTKP